MSAEDQERASRLDPHEEAIAERSKKVYVVITRIRQVVSDGTSYEDAVSKAEAKIAVTGSYRGYNKLVSVVNGEAGGRTPGAPIAAGEGIVTDEGRGAEAEK